jgi:primosomal protein N' (replication factor Y)
MTIARVALDLPVDRLFDYAAPGLKSEDVGKLAVVPFGRRKQVGLILGLAQHAEVAPSKLKHIDSVIQGGVALAPTERALLQFCAGYYHHPIGQVAFTALPPALRRIRRAALSAPRVQHCVLSAAGKALAPEHFSKRQLGARRLLAHVQAHNQIAMAELETLGAAAWRAAKMFLEQGWLTAVEAAPGSSAQTPTDVRLTSEQALTSESITTEQGRFNVWLLHGITGSGKTEVYLRAVEATLQSSKQALLLLPEINLTPKIEARFRFRFPSARIACLHSAVSEVERARQFLSAQNGQADIVIGTRLSVFTPLPRLGLIVVDEEHDASYKQNDGLRYNARDLAIYRAKQRDVPVILGSATPSLESYANARAGRYRLLTLNERAQPTARLPATRLINMRGRRSSAALSAEVLDELRARLRRGEQSLVFINRRGYAPVVFCPSCGWTAPCTRCSARMVLHTRDHQLHCHYCGRIAPAPDDCPQCGEVDLLPVGRGTQRIEALLREALPDARLLRVDRDSMARKDAWAQALAKIERHEVDILVGTQMLAKGHDFERLTLVAMLDVDQALFSPDFRAAERLFALIVQVAGRAGRAQLPGEVLVQTMVPDHPLFSAALAHDYAAFARTELAAREAAGFPPFVHQALLRAEALQPKALHDFMQRAAAQARTIKPKVTVYDPLAPAIERVAGKSRLQLLLQSRSRQQLQAFLRRWNDLLEGAKERRVRWAIDVDPFEL